MTVTDFSEISDRITELLPEDAAEAIVLLAQNLADTALCAGLDCPGVIDEVKRAYKRAHRNMFAGNFGD